MPFNSTQRRVLSEVLKHCIDDILDNQRSANFLKESINSSLPSLEETLGLLKQQKWEELENSFSTTDIPGKIKSIWIELGKHIKEGNTWKPTISQLEILEEFPNYNPISIAALLKFEDMLNGNGNFLKN